MVGIFSKFGVWSGHRRSISSSERRETLPSNSEVMRSHGLEMSVEFKPVEHPMEPLDGDQPIPYPLPEPSLLNDGRIRRDRISSASVRPRSDQPVFNKGTHKPSESASKI